MKSIEEIADAATAELFGTGNFARLMRPYVEEAVRDHPDWKNWSMTDQKLYLSDDIDLAFMLLHKQKNSKQTE